MQIHLYNLAKKGEEEEGQGGKGRGKKRNVKNQGKGGKEWRRGGGEKMVKKGRERTEKKGEETKKSTRKDNFNINVLGCPIPNSQLVHNT